MFLFFSVNGFAAAVMIYYTLPQTQVGDKVVQLYATHDKLLAADEEIICVMPQVGTYYGNPVFCAELEDNSVNLIQLQLCTPSTTGEGENAEVKLTPVEITEVYKKGTVELAKKLSAYDGKMYDATGSAAQWINVELDNHYVVYHAGAVNAATLSNASKSYAATITATDKTYKGSAIHAVSCDIPFSPTQITFDEGEARTYADGKLYTADACLEYAYDGGPYTIMGEFNSWASPGLEFQDTDEEGVVSVTLYLIAGTPKTFKVVYDGYCYGSADNITKESTSLTLSSDVVQAFTVTPDAGGLYEFRLNVATLQMAVVYPTFAEPTNPRRKPVWQQSDANSDYYIKTRKALVGNGCEVNKLAVVVGVGSGASGLGNLTDEDLSNYVTLTKVVGASIGTNPIAGVRDMNNHYAAGTKAGFHVLTSSDSKVLSLDVIKAFAISFYCEGKLVGTVPIAPEVQVLQLDLISFSANSGATIDIEATAPAEFDEILLQPGGGINADVVNAMKIQYAYVGTPYKYTLTNQGAEAPHGIEEFKKDYKRQLSLSATYGGVSTLLSDHLINADLTDGVSGNTVTLGNLVCAVSASTTSEDQHPDEAPFKAGYNVGMHFSSGSVLNLGLGGTKTMELLDKDGKVLQTEHLNTTVLGLGIAAGGAGDNVITANQDFWGVKFVMAGVSVNLGAFVTHYFYVTPPPTVDHHCPINATAHTDMCDYDTSFQLSHNSAIPVTWTVKSQPEGANASVDNATQLASNMTVEGTYIFTATAADGCKQDVTLTRGKLQVAAVIKDGVLHNVDREVYALSDEIHESSGSLISISNLSDPENILNGQFDDYAQYVGGLSLADNLMVCGIKTKDGSTMTAKKRVGFVVETLSSGLDLSAVNLFHIRGYKQGMKVFDKVVEESNTVALNLIGSNKVQKMRYSVRLDGTEEFDEFQIWKSGVLSLSIDRLNIYYGFANEESHEAAGKEESALGCGLQVISSTTTGASINSDANSNLQVLGVANVSDNVTYLIDDDLDTYLTVANTVNVGGGTYAVRLGRTFGPSYQLGIVIDKETYAASIGLGAWLTMATYKDGVATGDVNNEWSVLGVNAIGAGDKSLLLMYPTKEFDEVRITMAGVAQALQYPKLHGIVVRNDVDQDGIPDCEDTQSCFEELVLDEDAGRPDRNTNAHYNAKGRDYSKARLVLHRSITRGSALDKHVWCSLILPVNLTGLQVRNAFGNDTRIAKAHSLDENNPHVLNFQNVPLTTENDQQVVLEAGQYYIIQTLRTPEIDKEKTYTCADGTVLHGEVYFVNDVDYDKRNDDAPAAKTLGLPTSSDRWTAEHGYYPVDFAGAYSCTTYPVGSYVFSGGNLYKQYGAHNINAFRFWIKEQVPAESSEAHELTFQMKDDEGKVTQIIPVRGGEAFVEASGKVFNMAGQCVAPDASALRGLKRGVYVVGGKKMIR